MIEIIDSLIEKGCLNLNKELDKNYNRSRDLEINHSEKFSLEKAKETLFDFLEEKIEIISEFGEIENTIEFEGDLELEI